MKTRTIMLSSLAIAALATVTLNATEALAKSGGGGGMRSFSAARTPVVVKQFKTVTPSTVKKLTTPKLTTPKLTDNRIKNIKDKITLNPQPLPPGGVGPIKDPGKPPIVVVGPKPPIGIPPKTLPYPTGRPIVVDPKPPIGIPPKPLPLPPVVVVDPKPPIGIPPKPLPFPPGGPIVVDPKPPIGIPPKPLPLDRKSTRLNSSHLGISYAVFR